ncbi:MAG: MFS transporter [Coriobacteriia bacterium]|nr:MFS transporter [Coriobacteriia bacterium]
MAVYLLGLLLGGLYVGLIAPVRLVIQQDFGIGDDAGIWMINIYSLFYAACIPVIGKLADNHGRRTILIACLLVFGVGSTLCALSQALGFAVLLAGRVVQAVGACGIIPVANAEMGTAVPPEKRGLALGLTAAVSGLSNVLGSAVGSGLLFIAGNENWPFLFWVAVPACLLLAVAAKMVLANNVVESPKRLDLVGSALFVAMVLLLLVALQNLDFFAFAETAVLPQVWLPLAGMVACLATFRTVERRVADPVFHLEYLHNRAIVVTMVVSFFVGCITICMSLVPEIAEFIAEAPTGSGGFYVIPVGVTCLFGPPLAGKLIDRFGPKPIMMGGLAASGAAYAFLAFVAVPSHNEVVLVLGLCLVGLGMGFVMGAPTNYMILENTSEQESTSAIATITLVRQIGTSVAPAVLVGFVAANPGAAGFQHLLMCVAAFCVLAFACMIAYQKNERP